MSMMQMLMASHISEGLGEVPPLPVEDKPWLTAEVDKGTAVRRAVKEVLTPFGTQPACVHQTARLSFDIEQPITAVRAWLIGDADDGIPVITGLAFRYRGSDDFGPDAPDPGDDAARRHRPLQTFREQTETLAAGESIVAVKCSSTAMEFTSEITFQTSQGRALVFGSHGTVIPWGPPDEMSADGAPLVGFVALRTILAPWVDWRSPNMEAIDVYGGATLTPIACYFSTAWKRRRSLVLLKALVKKNKATPPGLLWSRVLDADFEEGLWRHVVRCL